MASNLHNHRGGWPPGRFCVIAFPRLGVDYLTLSDLFALSARPRHKWNKNPNCPPNGFLPKRSLWTCDKLIIARILPSFTQVTRPAAKCSRSRVLRANLKLRNCQWTLDSSPDAADGADGSLSFVSSQHSPALHIPYLSPVLYRICHAPALSDVYGCDCRPAWAALIRAASPCRRTPLFLFRLPLTS